MCCSLWDIVTKCSPMCIASPSAAVDMLPSSGCQESTRTCVNASSAVGETHVRPSMCVCEVSAKQHGSTMAPFHLHRLAPLHPRSRIVPSIYPALPHPTLPARPIPWMNMLQSSKEHWQVQDTRASSMPMRFFAERANVVGPWAHTQCARSAPCPRHRRTCVQKKREARRAPKLWVCRCASAHPSDCRHY